MDELDDIVSNERSPQWLRDAGRLALFALQHDPIQAANAFEHLAQCVRRRWMKSQIG